MRLFASLRYAQNGNDLAFPGGVNGGFAALTPPDLLHSEELSFRALAKNHSIFFWSVVKKKLKFKFLKLFKPNKKTIDDKIFILLHQEKTKQLK